MNFSGNIFLVFVLVIGLNPLIEPAFLIDREALLSFKSHIVDLPKPLSTWDIDLSPCNWTGISCDKLCQRVVKLDLSGFGLAGSITPYLGNLSFLESLELQQNHLTGAIPPQLGNLFHLQILNLSSNALEGVIPCNLSRLKELKVLDLRQNKISGDIPAEISLLTGLHVLNLQGNKLSGPVPAFLANISSLVYLNLGTNEFSSSIPMDFARLNMLKVLDLTDNKLSGSVPPSIYNISSLVHLGLASNKLWGEIPGDIGVTLPNLITLISCYNKFTGTIPWSLHNLTNIKTIRISHNLLHGGIPPGLGNLPNLEMYKVAYNSITTYGRGGLRFLELLTNSTRLSFLALDFNLLEGEIPMSIGNLSKVLMKLYLGGNNIYGTIPSSIGELEGLGLLSLMDNNISGEIPHEIGQLKELNILELSENRLCGTIPSSFGALQHLNKIDLSKNELTGSIPNSLGNLQKLISMDLSYNKLNGSIPNEIFKLHGLSAFLNLSKNHLTGTLHPGIGSLELVMVISISDNKLSGNIPNSFTHCGSLEKLFLARNMFSGKIPQTLGDVKGLETVDLSSNLLSGAIPVELQKLKSLQLLNLSFNELEGHAPTGGIFSDPCKVHLEGNQNLYFDLLKNLKVRRRKLTFIYVIISVVSVVLISLSICLLYYIKRSRTTNQNSFESLTGKYEMVTYNKLRLATDDFSQENLIGRGSFGCVYKGHLQGVDVAVKVLDTAVARSRKSFLAECVALKNVRHRNLVKLVTICSSIDSKNDEFLALIFQLMSNGSLDDWIRGNRRHTNGMGLSVFDRLTCAIGIASAIDYLHNETNVPVLHCDLKPSNVLLDSDMTPKVADFGLAKLLLDENINQLSFGFSHTITGSIGYIPPEYGAGKVPSTSGDVYSFGILLLEIFTGKSPTNDIFKAGLSLRSWVQEEFPNNLEQILDPDLLKEMRNIGGNGQLSSSKLENHGDCLIRVFSAGLSCTIDSANERISIREALCKLKAIEKSLFKPESEWNSIDQL